MRDGSTGRSLLPLSRGACVVVSHRVPYQTRKSMKSGAIVARAGRSNLYFFPGYHDVDNLRQNEIKATKTVEKT